MVALLGMVAAAPAGALLSLAVVVAVPEILMLEYLKQNLMLNFGDLEGLTTQIGVSV